MEFKSRIDKKKYYSKRILIGLGIILLILIIGLEVLSPIFISSFEDLVPDAEIQRIGGEFYENKGDKMYYADYKNNSDQTLLLIHGLGGSSFTWRKNISYLSSKYHVITVDLLGFGISKNVSSKDIGLDRDLEVIQQFIVDKKLTNITIIGNSIGGIIAQKLAIKDTKNINSIVLVNSLDSSTSYSSSLTSSLLTLPLFKNPISALSDKFFIANSVRQSYYDQTQIDKLTIEGYEKNYRYRNSQLESAAFIQSKSPNIENLSNLKQLTLVYSSSEDKVINPSSQVDLSRKIVNSTLISIPHVGDLIMEEQPTLMNEGIDKWIQEVMLKKNVA